jgi:hypothetical protein
VGANESVKRLADVEIDRTGCVCRGLEQRADGDG